MKAFLRKVFRFKLLLKEVKVGEDREEQKEALKYVFRVCYCVFLWGGGRLCCNESTHNVIVSGIGWGSDGVGSIFWLFCCKGF